MAKIMVIDDSAYARHILKNALEKGGFEVVEASNGTEALEQIPIAQPNLVTMDLLMPGMQGQELLQHIKTSYPGLSDCCYCRYPGGHPPGIAGSWSG